MLGIEQIVEESGKFLERELGLSVEKSVLNVYSHEDWQTFIEQYHFSRNAQGVYIPRTLSANVSGE